MEINIAQVSQTVLKNDVAAGFTERHATHKHGL